jgi:hypothetical protein
MGKNQDPGSGITSRIRNTAISKIFVLTPCETIVGAQDLYMKVQDLYEISLYGITAMMA